MTASDVPLKNLRKLSERVRPPLSVGLVAREAASNKVVGVVNINEIVAGAFQSAYLGYYGMLNFARTGLMTEALRAAVDFAFSELGLHRLEANIQPGNTASIALVRRVGFKQEGLSPSYLRINGEWRDHERWALLADMLGQVERPLCVKPKGCRGSTCAFAVGPDSANNGLSSLSSEHHPIVR